MQGDLRQSSRQLGASRSASDAASCVATNGDAIYGAGFAAVYASTRYTAFSEKLAKLALTLIADHGAPGGELLDLACGVGAGTALLADAGYDVIGVDRSLEMVRRAADRFLATGRNGAFEQADMCDFSLGRPVDVVTCLGDALNYLIEDETLVRAFHCVARSLRPMGLFVFDVNTPHGLATRWGTRDVLSTARPEMVEINQHRYDASTRINSTRTTVFVRSADSCSAESPELYERHAELHRERGYDQETLAPLLELAGLRPVSFEAVPDMSHGWKTGLAPLAPDTGRIMVAAQRT